MLETERFRIATLKRAARKSNQKSRANQKQTSKQTITAISFSNEVRLRECNVHSDENIDYVSVKAASKQPIS